MGLVNNVNIIQKGNKYELWIQINNSTTCVGHIAMPPDNQIFKDISPLEKISAELAKRWGVLEKKGKK